MNLIGVAAHGVELATLLATLLKSRGTSTPNWTTFVHYSRQAALSNGSSFVLIQEGSSVELYLHARDTAAEA